MLRIWGVILGISPQVIGGRVTGAKRRCRCVRPRLKIHGWIGIRVRIRVRVLMIIGAVISLLHIGN